jgi:hypothetical protein
MDMHFKEGYRRLSVFCGLLGLGVWVTIIFSYNLLPVNKAEVFWRAFLGAVIAFCVPCGFVLAVAWIKEGFKKDQFRQREHKIISEKYILLDSQNKIRVELGVFPGDMVYVGLNDQEGKFRALLSIGPDGAPGLEFLDKNGQRRAFLGLNADDSPILEFRDKSGNIIAKAP